jgi:Resolvase, N terminal domain
MSRHERRDPRKVGVASRGLRGVIMAGTPAAAWYRVSTDEQDSGNQVPDVSAFAAHDGYDVVRRYEVSDSAWKRGTEYRATLKQAMDDAYAGQFEVLIVWSLDRLIREGAEQTLRLFRQSGSAAAPSCRSRSPG